MTNIVSVNRVIGYKISDDEVDKIRQGDGLQRWAVVRGVDVFFGGYPGEEAEVIAGLRFGEWTFDVGVHEIDDTFGHVHPAFNEAIERMTNQFGEEPKRYLVVNYA